MAERFVSLLKMTDEQVVAWIYAHPVSGGKGDSTAQSAESSQNSFDQTLQAAFGAQYANQINTLNYLQGKMQAQVNAGGTGYNAATLAAMRTQSTDQTAAAYQQAKQASQNQEFSEGGQNLPSGVNAQINAGLASTAAQANAQNQEGISINNAQLQNQNYWNSVSALNGVAQEYNPLGYSSGATAGAGAVAGLSEANTQASGPTWGSVLGGVVGAGLGAAGTAYAGQAKGCWIAASFYGWNSAETDLLRRWLHTKAPKWFRRLYLAHGERIARTPIRWLFRPIFEAVLMRFA